MKRLIFLTALIVLALTSTTHTEGQSTNCMEGDVGVNPSTVTVGQSVTINAKVINACKGNRTASFAIDVHANCNGEQWDNILNLPNQVYAGYEQVFYSVTYSPPCADSWLVSASTLRFPHQEISEALASFSVAP